jgi:trans-aconitate methyltransferase
MSEDESYRDSHTGTGKGEQYDSYYSTDPWQSFMWRREQACIDNLLDTHLANRDVRLLDFACGSGRLTQFLETRVAKSTGVDVSDSMLDQARAKLKQTELIKADLTQENALDGRKFDLITAFRFFTNAEDELRRAVIGRLAEHLEEDGYLLFNNHHVPEAMYFRAQMLIARLRGLAGNSRFRMMSMDDTYALIAEAGLRVVATRRVGFLHLPRLDLPDSVVDAAESAATRFEWSARRCESVMLLCAR